MRKIDVSNLRVPGTKLEGWRAVAVGAVALYTLLFLILNNRSLKVDFVFFSVKSNELLALVVIVVLGFLGGYVIGQRQPRRPAEPAPRELPPVVEATPAPPPPSRVDEPAG